MATAGPTLTSLPPSQQLPKLTSKDASILATLFDPESSPSSFLNNPSNPASITIDSTLPPDQHISSVSLLAQLKRREIEAIKCSEAGGVKRGLEVLSGIIESEEGRRYASAYVNRAMGLRLLYTDQSGGNGSKAIEQNDGAEAESGAGDGVGKLRIKALLRDTTILSDLRKAVELALPPTSGGEEGMRGMGMSMGRRISEGQAKVLSQAYTHLGMLFLSLSKEVGNKHEGLGSGDLDSGDLDSGDLDSAAPDRDEDGKIKPSGIIEMPENDAAAVGGQDLRKDKDQHSHSPPELRMTKEDLEHLSSTHFALGGKFGNELGRAMAVRTNPYAKMCGGIVREAMRKEILGEGVADDES